MAAQYQEFTGAGVEVLAIVNDSVRKARAYFQEHRFPFSCLADPQHRVYDQYQVQSKVISLGQRPGLFIIDRDGIVQYAHIGWQQWDIPRNKYVLEVCRGIPCDGSFHKAPRPY